MSRVTLARNFHLRVDLTLTEKKLLKYIKVKFYIRRRHNKLYLYSRFYPQGFGNTALKHQFLLDLLVLIPELKCESTQGHHLGLLLDVTTDEAVLSKYLKLLSFLAHPDTFYYKNTKVYKCYYNYPTSSSIPIHFHITQTQYNSLQHVDLINTFKSVQVFNDEISNTFNKQSYSM